MYDLVIHAERAIIGGELRPATIYVKNGVTVGIGAFLDPVDARKTIEVPAPAVLMGGLVNSHVLTDEPGRTEREDFETATKAAAAGGVTTIIDMPVNPSPVTTTYAAVQEKINSMVNKLWVDVGLLGCVLPNNLSEVATMVKDGGVLGFKCFMNSGVDDFSVREQRIRLAMEEFKKLGEDGFDVPYMVDAESRQETENDAIELVCKLAQEYQVPSHIVHLSSGDAIHQLATAQKDGVPVTVESAFHSLHLVSQRVPNGSREKENQEKLWKAIADGVITVAISEGDFMKAWGIASLQLGLPIMWTEARKRNFSLFDIQRWMSEEPANLVRLGDVKGPIKVGRDADFVIWNPDEEIEVDQTKLLFKNRLSPYHGERLYGRVLHTIVRGHTVFQDSDVAKKPIGNRVVPTHVSSRAAYPNPKLPPIHRLNTLPLSVFEYSINLLYETVPPLLQHLFERRPYESYEHLIETARAAVKKFSAEDRLIVVNAHPIVGLNPAQLKHEFPLSKREQGTETAPEIFEELRQLNDKYEAKFGFKFMEFVNGRKKSEIIPVLRRRLKGNDIAKELDEGLEQVHGIATGRLKKLLLLSAL